jgi:hypothetical protein
MEKSRKTILDRTSYGLTIYAHLLRLYYPGTTVLSLSGKDCAPTQNPFNKDKATLMVQIVDNCARHTDSDKAIPNGDAFDFAQLHYKLQGQELLQAINDDLNLHIDKDDTSNDQTLDAATELNLIQRKLSITRFSYFKKPISNIRPSLEMNLLDVYQIIIGKAFADKTKALRKIEDPKQARKYKASNFDYVTFSGTFSKRKDADLKKHSGLLTIDFDHIPNLEKLKKLLLADDYFETELMFVSPSGDGLKWIISIDLSLATHAENFQAIANYLKHTYNIELDKSGSDISRSCFLPHDPDAYINPKYTSSNHSNTKDHDGI